MNTIEQKVSEQDISMESSCISIDDRRSELNFPSEQKLGEVIDAIVESLPPNRIVTEIVLNGTQLSISHVREVLNSDFNTVSSLDVKTADRTLWAVNGVDISLSAIQPVQRSLLRCAELFREDDNGLEANRYFSQCIEGIERFIEALTITRSVRNLDFDALQVDGIPLSKLEQQLENILQAIHDSQLTGDLNGIADRVEYELLTNLSCWTRALRSIGNPSTIEVVQDT